MARDVSDTVPPPAVTHCVLTDAAVYNRRVTATGDPRPGEIRFTSVGDLEIFDGHGWLPVDQPILADPSQAARDLNRNVVPDQVAGDRTDPEADRPDGP